jgi:hypothetical protein
LLAPDLRIAARAGWVFVVAICYCSPFNFQFGLPYAEVAETSQETRK